MLKNEEQKCKIKHAKYLVNRLAINKKDLIEEIFGESGKEKVSS